MTKYIFLVFIIILTVVLRAQPGTNQYNTLFNFGSSISGSGATIDSAGFGYFGLRTSASADTIESQVFTQKQFKGGGALYIHCRRDTLDSVSGASTLQMGVWRGDSYNGGIGWEWKHLKTWAAATEGDAKVVLLDSTWFSKEMTMQWKYRYIESEADSNMYFLDQYHYQTAK